MISIHKTLTLTKLWVENSRQGLTDLVLIHLRSTDTEVQCNATASASHKELDKYRT